LRKQFASGGSPGDGSVFNRIVAVHGKANEKIRLRSGHFLFRLAYPKRAEVIVTRYSNGRTKLAAKQGSSI
jgi:hypothetical protein